MARGGTLTPKQRIFVSEYLVDLNATQAAIRAGYSAKTASWIGPQLLVKTHVVAEIEKAMANREKRTLVTADAVVAELAKIGFANMQDYLQDGFSLQDIQKLTRDQAAAIQEITIDGDKVRFKLADKRAALVDIGRHLGIFERDNKQSNPADAVAAVIAEIQANSKRTLPGDEGETA
jgi:phage terminase small subunit